jgi:hypothetical protein
MTHHFDADAASGRNFDAAPAPPFILYTVCAKPTFKVPLDQYWIISNLVNVLKKKHIFIALLRMLKIHEETLANEYSKGQ